MNMGNNLGFYTRSIAFEPFEKKSIKTQKKKDNQCEMVKLITKTDFSSSNTPATYLDKTG